MYQFGFTPFPRLWWLAVVVLLIGADQVTKSYFSNAIPLGSAVAITDWFNLVHVLNAGAAFSLLADAGGWQRYFLIFIGVICVVGVSFACLKRKVDAFEMAVGAAVVAGGGGNLIDRIQAGAVVDFLDMHWRGVHWPAFNLADVFVVAAVIAWVLFSLKMSIQSRQSHRAAESGS